MEKKTGNVKVLVVAPDNLGDAVMASCVLPPLRRRFPNAKIGLWVKAYAAGLFEGHSKINRLHTCDPFWDTAPGQGKGGFGDFQKMLKEIRKERYDTALILNSEWRRALAVMTAGVPRRVGLNRRKSFLFLTRRAEAGGRHEHFVDQHRRVLETWLGEKVAPSECVPDLEGGAGRSGGSEDKFIIAVHPFSGDPRKNWPIERWKDLLERLVSKNKNFHFLLICGAFESEALQPLVRLLPPESITVKAGAPLSEIKKLLSRVSLAIGGDSGPGHIAAAVGTPVISLFGFTDPERSRAIGRRPVKIIKREPLSELEVGEVEPAIQEFIANPALNK